MLSYFVIYYEKFKNVMQRTEKKALMALDVVDEWSKVLIPVPWPLFMVGSTWAWAHNCSGSYPWCFMSSFYLYISFRLTLWVASVPLESRLAYTMYLHKLRIANHILIKIFFTQCHGWLGKDYSCTLREGSILFYSTNYWQQFWVQFVL